ncbi:MAG: hypothetical protein C4309_04335, partial [Chloroflexota bacterium]
MDRCDHRSAPGQILPPEQRGVPGHVSTRPAQHTANPGAIPPAPARLGLGLGPARAGPHRHRHREDRVNPDHRNLPLFEVKEVSYVYAGRFIALDRVSLSIWPGERVAILGANGSGKSTLLKLLDGLYFPTQGEVHFQGRLLSEAAFEDEDFAFDFRRCVSLIFQDADIQLFSPTVWDEVAFGPLQLGLSRDEVIARTQAALAALGIARLRERTPYQLSGGEKRKVAIASVLSLGPEVWLMDEPTAGLDPRSQSWLVDFICQEGERGHTVVTATQDLDIVADI